MSLLSDYLDQHKIRQADFASDVRTTQATISRLASGAGAPSLDLAVRIERVTDGAVPATSWIPFDAIDCMEEGVSGHQIKDMAPSPVASCAQTQGDAA